MMCRFGKALPRVSDPWIVVIQIIITVAIKSSYTYSATDGYTLAHAWNNHTNTHVNRFTCYTTCLLANTHLSHAFTHRAHMQTDEYVSHFTKTHISLSCVISLEWYGNRMSHLTNMKIHIDKETIKQELTHSNTQTHTHTHTREIILRAKMNSFAMGQGL